MKIKRALSLLLSLIMILGMLPTVALADDCAEHTYGDYTFNSESKTYETVCTVCGDVKTAEHILGQLPGDLLDILYESSISLDHVYDMTGEGFESIDKEYGADAEVYSTVTDPDSLLGEARIIDPSKFLTESGREACLVPEGGNLSVGVPTYFNGGEDMGKTYFDLPYYELNANPGEYVLYEFKNVNPTDCTTENMDYIHMTSSWLIQNKAACSQYQAELTDEDGKAKTVDMYMSMKIVGDTAVDPVYYIDRIIYVDKNATGGSLFVPTKHTISWDTDGDGDVDSTTEVSENVKPRHPDGYKAPVDRIAYQFTGWSPKVVPTTGTATYTANFTEVPNHEFGEYVYNKLTKKYSATCIHCGHVKTADNLLGQLPSEVLIDLYQNNISLDNVYDFTGEGFDHNGTWDTEIYSMQDDPDSLLGRARVIDTALSNWETPEDYKVMEGGYFTIGAAAYSVPPYADGTPGHVTVNVSYKEMNAHPGEYVVHKLENVNPTAHAYFYMAFWVLQNREVCGKYKPQLTNFDGTAKLCNLYVSMKVVGDTAETPQYWIDRVILVEKETTGGPIYTPPMRTVSFDANGGEGTMEDLTVILEGKITLPENGFIRDNAIFDGWQVGDTVYAPGEKVFIDADTEIVACWNTDTFVFDEPIVPNAGFEDGEVGYVPNDWYSCCETEVISDAEAFSGNHSLYLSKADPYDDTIGAYSSLIPGKAGQTYYVEAMVKGSGEMEVYAEQYADEDRNYVTESAMSVTVTEDWSKFRGFFTLEEDCSYFDLLFVMGNGFCGDVYIDDVKIVAYNHAYALMSLNKAVAENDAPAFFDWTGHELSLLVNVKTELLDKYMPALSNAMSSKGGDLTVLEMQAVITSVNTKNKLYLPEDIGTQLELFVEDTLIDPDSTAELVVKQPTAENYVHDHSEPWGDKKALYHTVFKDDDVYRMYYRCVTWDSGIGNICYDESPDGINWTSPELGLYEHNGDGGKNNIIISGAEHGKQIESFFAFKDTNPLADESARYKALMVFAYRWDSDPTTPDGSHAYGMQSADGIHWEMMNGGQIIFDGTSLAHGHMDSHNICYWNEATNEYVMYVRYNIEDENGETWRKLRVLTSKDFLNWKTMDDAADLSYYWDYVNDNTDQYGSIPTDYQMYTPGVGLYDRAPHLYVGLPCRYMNHASQVAVYLMASRDGVDFKWWDDPIIAAEGMRAGDRAAYPACGIVRTGDTEISIYCNEGNFTPKHQRFSYRVDGFVAAQGGAEGATLLTKPIKFAGDHLILNYAAANGSVRVQLMDLKENPIPGFTFDDCTPLTGDSIGEEVIWAGGSLSELVGKNVKVMFELTNAELYSYQFMNGIPGAFSIVGENTISGVSEARLNWDNADYALSYKIVVAEDASFTKVVKNYTALANFVNVDGLDSSKTYYWKVQAVGAAGTVWNKEAGGKVANQAVGYASYEPITTTGKTLADANLTGTFTSPATGKAVTGKLFWVDGENTKVERNTAYIWKFVPDDPCYKPTVGALVPYSASNTVTLASFFGANVNLGNTLDMNFYIKTDTVADTGYAEIVRERAGVAEETVTVQLSDCEKNNGYYVITYSGLAAKEMTDKLYVTVYDADGNQVSEVMEDSMQDYAMRMLPNATSAEEQTLYVDMLNYGAAAQEHFTYNTSNLANSQLTEEQKAYGTQSMTLYSLNRPVRNYVAYAGANLDLESRIFMNLYAKADVVGEGAYMVVSYTDHTNNEKVFTLNGVKNGNLYQFNLAEFVVADGRCEMTCEIYTAEGKLVETVTESMERYITRMSSDYPWLEAIMKFSDAAYSFLHR